MQRLIRFFFQGLLILLPFVLTVYLVYLIFTMLNETLFSALGSLLQLVFPALEAGWVSDLAGGLVTLALIILTGMFASFYLGRFFLNLFDAVLTRIPLVKMLYNSLRDLFNALLGDNKRFDKPVAVSLMSGEVMVLGFITREEMEEFGLKDKVAVYLPQSYNFAGNVLIVDKDKVRPLDIPAGTVTTFIVSGGVTGKP
ncbi:hypothetical protein AN401_14305 [Zobellella denitrificans]|uniref:DUF502 domain-containing protein n=1 Tax=Zobellella denitrificans TaxID=347534 RepID=A0A291HRV8_9GAMM|nr:DUF502 domain-containing protein [Zobellella denitrificans]ATG74885.1 hypothetical protein AN401_14305 [Zobellella denitrificans]